MSEERGQLLTALDDSDQLPDEASRRARELDERELNRQSVRRATAAGTRTNETRGAVAAELAPAAV